MKSKLLSLITISLALIALFSSCHSKSHRKRAELIVSTFNLPERERPQTDNRGNDSYPLYIDARDIVGYDFRFEDLRDIDLYESKLFIESDWFRGGDKIQCRIKSRSATFNGKLVSNEKGVAYIDSGDHGYHDFMQHVMDDLAYYGRQELIFDIDIRVNEIMPYDITIENRIDIRVRD